MLPNIGYSTGVKRYDDDGVIQKDLSHMSLLFYALEIQVMYVGGLIPIDPLFGALHGLETKQIKNYLQKASSLL